MKSATCTTHPGIKTDSHPCYRCHPDGAAASMMGTQAFGAMREAVAAMNVPEEAPVHEPATVVYNITNLQSTLDPTLFPPVRRADVPMVRISISGTIELTQEQYQAYLDGGTLGPGAVVDVRASGYVVQPGAAWVKRTEGSGEKRETWHEREGRIKIRLVDLGALSPSGEEWSEV